MGLESFLIDCQAHWKPPAAAIQVWGNHVSGWDGRYNEVDLKMLEKLIRKNGLKRFDPEHEPTPKPTRDGEFNLFPKFTFYLVKDA